MKKMAIILALLPGLFLILPIFFVEISFGAGVPTKNIFLYENKIDGERMTIDLGSDIPFPYRLADFLARTGWERKEKGKLFSDMIFRVRKTTDEKFSFVFIVIDESLEREYIIRENYKQIKHVANAIGSISQVPLSEHLNFLRECRELNCEGIEY